MQRFVEKVVYGGSALSLEPDVLRATGHAESGAPLEDHVLPSMYAQFDDDLALLHLSEAVPMKDGEKPSQVVPDPLADGAVPCNVRGDFTVCSPLVESVAYNASNSFKGALSKMLPTYDTIANLAHHFSSTRPRASTVVVAGHKRFYPAHFTSYYAYSYVAACISCAIDFGMWTAMSGVFTLLAFGGLLSTCIVLWVTCLATFAPRPVVNAPQVASPIPLPTEWVASYLYHMLSVGTFGSPMISEVAPSAAVNSTPHHFSLVWQFVADNVRPSETMLVGLCLVLVLAVASACFNLACCYTLALAPNALHRQWKSNGNNSMSSVIALGAHQIIRRYHQHAAAVRSRGVRMGRHALIAMIVLKLTVNMFLEMDKQGMFPASSRTPLQQQQQQYRPAGGSSGSSALPLADIVSTAAAFNRIVGFVTAFALAFVSADMLSGRLSNRLFMRGRVPFFVKCEAPTEEDAEKKLVAETERTSEFKTHAAICPRLPDRIRFRPPNPTAAKEGEEPSMPADYVDPNAGRRMYYRAGVRPDVPAGPAVADALNWLTELSPFVMSSEVVALAECFRKLLSVVITCVWMLAFWRWPAGWPFVSTFKALSASMATAPNGPVLWLVGLWTGHMNSVKGSEVTAEAASSPLSFSATVIGLMLGVAIAMLIFARRATAPTKRVAAKKASFGFDVKKSKAKGCVAPTVGNLLSHPASSKNFIEYIGIWAAAQAGPFLSVLDHNSLPPPPKDGLPPAPHPVDSPVTPGPVLPHTPTKALASVTSRPMAAIASAYATDKAGTYYTSVAPRRLGGLPMSDAFFMLLSLIITRQVLLYPFIGLVTAAVMPKLNAPRLSQPDTSLFVMLVEANPLLIGAMLLVTVHLWYVVLGLLRDARDGASDLWTTMAMTMSITSRVALLMGRTNTPLFRPLRHGYCDGVYDLCHAGHKRVIERASGCCDRLFAGSMCDEDCLGYKRRPVMSTAERAEEVARCQGVYRCLPASPPRGLPVALLAYYGITQIVYGEEYHKETDVYFVAARELKIGITAPRTESISTSDLLKRVLSPQ